MRTKFLKAVLSQEIAFFDPDGTTSAIVNRISTDTAFVQDAISEKVILVRRLLTFLLNRTVELNFTMSGGIEHTHYQ